MAILDRLTLNANGHAGNVGMRIAKLDILALDANGDDGKCVCF